MKHIFLISILLSLCSLLKAQEVLPQESKGQDSTAIVVYRSIFFELNQGPGNVVLNQDNNIERAVYQQVNSNHKKKKHGFRIRLFFDNKQSARNNSETIKNQFQQVFADIPVYRTYNNPYFIVSVGDFRTKSDAMRALLSVKNSYPNAIIIKDYIN